MSIFLPQTWLLRYLLKHSEALRSNILLSHLRYDRGDETSDEHKAEAWSILPVLVLAAVAKSRRAVETNYDLKPASSGTKSPRMSVRVHLDNPHQFYTNLDFISGKIILNLTSDETISAVVVKLEGESKTILIKPPPDYGNGRPPAREERNRIAMENHKILYKVQTVFPPVSSPTVANQQSFTLRAGHHEYPFRFKIPFNNMCGDTGMQNVGIGLSGRLGLIDLPANVPHVHKALPPSLSGFPGEAEIRYYVKVTVQRPSIWKENRRSAIGFKFMPIEPPRPPKSNAEAFARRAHTFKPSMYQPQKKGLFGRTPQPVTNNPFSVLVDARLPSPTILVCRTPLPLRLLIKKQTDCPEQIFLRGLEVELIGTTHVRAQSVLREEHSLFPVLNLHGLAIPIGSPSDPVNTENAVSPSLWDRVPLPPTVTPSFATCNLSRTYHLDLRVIVGYGTVGDINPQTQMIPLRFPVEVYSGITPPPELVAQAAQTAASRPQIPTPQPTEPILPPRPGAQQSNEHMQPPPVDPLYPPQMGTANAEMMGDAPPSYEDAMADEIGPLDGRREYSGVTNENAPSEVIDGKGAGQGAVPGYSVTDPKAGAGPSTGGGRVV